MPSSLIHACTRQQHRGTRLSRIVFALAIIIGASCMTPSIASASIYFWNVDADGEWTNPANWLHVAGSGPIGAGYPNAPGDVAAFTSTYSADRAIVFSNATLTVGQILINSAHNIAIVGGVNASLVFDNGTGGADVVILGHPSEANHELNVAMQFKGTLTFTIDNNTGLRLARLEETGGPGAVIKRGPGFMLFTGANRYTGRTAVERGTLQAFTAAGFPSVPGELVVGNGTGAPRSAIVYSAGTNAYADTARVTIERDGEMLVADPERFGELVIHDGSIFLSGSTNAKPVVRDLTMIGGVITVPNGNVVSIEGTFAASSSGAGPATVIANTNTSGVKAGVLNLIGTRTFAVDDGPQTTDLDLQIPVVSETGGLIKDGAGTLRFASPGSNTYAGETFVRRGKLELACAGTSVAGNLRIGDGSGAAVAALMHTNAINDLSTVTVGAGGLFVATNASDAIATLAIEGGEVRLGDPSPASLSMRTLTMTGGRMTIVEGSSASPLTQLSVLSSNKQAVIDGKGFLRIDGVALALDVNDGSQPIDLRIDTPIASTDAVPLLKRGSGVASLTADFVRPGATRILEGTLLVNGTQAQNLFQLESGALGGTGTLGTLTATGGVLSPGQSPGRLRTGPLSLSASTQFAVELSGPAPGASYDQVAVTGGVSLGNATLAVTIGNALPPDAKFVIIDNDGADPISGRFAGLDEGDTVEVGSHEFTLSYRGGDGNDVVLTDNSPVSYYLAEGATGGFFDEDVLIANPNASDAPVTLTFLLEGGHTVVAHRTVPAQSRLTVRADDIPGIEATAASVKVTSDKRLPLVVERTMFWDQNYYGGHTANAVDRPEKRWIFAEGFQGFFDTYVLIANANAEETVATLTFLREGASPVVATVPVGPFSRHTVHARDYPELRGHAFGIIVDATRPVIAERAMYFNSTPDHLWRGGHANTGIVEPSTSWFHAEGATGGFFNTFILLSNPNATPAHVTVKFLLTTGEVVAREKTIPAQERLTINPASEDDPRLKHAELSTVVQSDVPIVSERSMYWAGEAKDESTPWGEGHNSSGVTSLATRWGLAEGRVGGEHKFATFILLTNPGSETAKVTVTFLREGGAPVVQTYEVQPTSRFNIDASSVPALRGTSFGAHIESTNGVPIAVERSLYWNALGAFWAGGTNALGTPLP